MKKEKIVKSKKLLKGSKVLKNNLQLKMKSRMILGFGICLPLALLFLLLAWGFFLVVGMGYDKFIIITGEIIQGKHLMIIFITWVGLGIILGMGLRSIFLTNKDTHIHHMHTIERIGYVLSIVDTFPEEERKKLLRVLNSMLTTKNINGGG